MSADRMYALERRTPQGLFTMPGDGELESVRQSRPRAPVEQRPGALDIGGTHLFARAIRQSAELRLHRGPYHRDEHRDDVANGGELSRAEIDFFADRRGRCCRSDQPVDDVVDVYPIRGQRAAGETRRLAVQ